MPDCSAVRKRSRCPFGEYAQADFGEHWMQRADGGRPKKVLYDQDKVLLHDENLGDLILTKCFRAFVNQQHFEPVFCRKSDPESKGKVENVVKYVKQNFG